MEGVIEEVMEGDLEGVIKRDFFVQRLELGLGLVKK